MKFPTAIAFCSLLLAACGSEGRDQVGASGPASASKASGSIDFAMSAVTLSRNSKGDEGSAGCELSFAATNNSGNDLKSVLVEFEVSEAATSRMIDAKATLVMPFRIARGGQKEAWGPIYLDNARCESLRVKITQPSSPGMCITVNKAQCAPYRLSGTGVAQVE